MNFLRRIQHRRFGYSGDGEVEDYQVDLRPNFFFDTFATSVNEGAGSIDGRLSITAPLTDDLEISLVSDDQSEAVVPLSVTIPSGQVEVFFPIDILTDNLVDGTQNVTITASAPTFDNRSVALEVTDIDVSTLTVSSVTTSSIEEGGTRTGVAQISTPLTTDLVVTLDIVGDEDELSVPNEVTIIAGQQNVQFLITGVDENIDDGDQVVTVSATSSLNDSSFDMTVIDDDTTVLSLSIDSPEINENGGAATATVQLSNPNSQPIVIALASSDTSEATVPASITVEAGEIEASFVITAVDDSVIDGTQTISITGTSALGNLTSSIDVLNDDFNSPATGLPSINGIAQQNQTVKAWTRGVDFQNNQFYNASVEISEQDYAFTSNAKIRLVSDASGNGDDVYIDEIKISAR